MDTFIFMALFDLSNLGGQMENLKFYCGFDVEKREDFGAPLSESINIDYPYPAVLLLQKLECVNRERAC